MKLITIFSALVGIANADFPAWHPASYGDSRGPCPALNALANHGFLPHDGKAISIPVAVKAMGDALNVSQETAMFTASAAVTTSADPSKGLFDLSDLSKHGIIEHDGSLSRKDVSVDGDNHSFDQKIFDEFLQGLNITSGNVTIPIAAKGRWSRILTEKGRDPKFQYSARDRFNSYAETSIYFSVLQDPVSGSVPLEWLKVFFEQERLPYNEGWRTQPNAIRGFPFASTVLAVALATPEKLGDVSIEGSDADVTSGFHMQGLAL
ncbi:Cloroperoxidase [Lophiostoma macrostomum CBS 122681]|uniref:Cloroperoxidase n=1 Tax=Lophiostoma macrostomum CBS 122681 TaxID=1314788 RepID=A0A6A6SYP9_9PLEO|nr:Cloroperoxidase [Lophiostoma macrostomum CBS 122681]